MDKEDGFIQTAIDFAVFANHPFAPHHFDGSR
jgi:hypothetical protein